jgi:hypothetical protein
MVTGEKQTSCNREFFTERVIDKEKMRLVFAFSGFFLYAAFYVPFFV